MSTKHVTAYYVDARDGRPASEAPLRHGPAKPSESLEIDAVDRRQEPALIIGRIPSDEPLEDGMALVSREEHTDLIADYQAWRDANAARELAKRRESMVVTAFQAFAALDAAGHLETVESMMADPETPKVHRLAFQKAQEFRRNSPTVEAWLGSLGLSAEEGDALFDHAAEIEA
jgi:hypothetical protein